MTETHETEDSIRRWRAALPPGDHDALEGQLRDELDALAEVGLHGDEAFAHAIAKVTGGRRDVAWRVPAILFSCGVLVHLLGGAGRSLLDALTRLASTSLHLGVGVGSVERVLVLVLPPIVGILAVMRYAPKLGVGPIALRPSLRIGLVVAMGLFVFAAHHLPIPSSFRRLDAEALRTLNAWYAIEAPTYRLVWRVLPFALAGALIVARRLAVRGRPGKDAAFWMLAGLLVYDVVGIVSSASSILVIRIGHHAALAPRSMLPMGVTVTLAVGALLAVLSFAAVRRLPSPRVILASRLTDVAAVVLALASLPFVFRYQLWPLPMRDFSIVEASMHAQMVVVAAYDVAIPAMLGAVVGWLRSPHR